MNKMLYLTIEGLEKLKFDYKAAKEAYNNASYEFNTLSKDVESASSIELVNLNLAASQLNQLDTLIKSPFVIIEEMPEYKNWDGTTIIRKCEVTLDYAGEVETYKILGCNESNLMENILSCDAPLSEVLIGHKVGDVVTYNNQQIKINDIKPIVSKKEIDNPILGKTL